ncbi:threonine-phosphate decarboxylase [Natronorarus salvus]|uniref:threonine-phosphate decarboxylase n=1 Tax=Natronorarus salvus TaxID=3117733 RepID=UPI002F26C65C
MDPDAARRVERVPHGGGVDSGLIDFSANVNPETAPGVTAVYDGALAVSKRYHADDYTGYRTAAGASVGCEPISVIPTAGGLDGIRLALSVHVDRGDRVLLPYPSFGEYAREVRLQGAEPEFVPVEELLDTDPEGYAMAIVCNPNNPTGLAFDADDLTRFLERCRAAGTVLLADEAFLGFTDRPSMAGLDGAVVIRSLTKLFGLPGLRAGFAVATDDLYEPMERARLTWNLSTPAAAVGAHCLRSKGFVEETRARVESERERMAEALSEGYEVHPSDAPFLLLDVGDRSVEEVVETARDGGIAIRDARSFRGLDSHVRCAVRTPAQNDRLIGVLSLV